MYETWKMTDKISVSCYNLKTIYSVSQKIPLSFSDSPNCTHLLHVPIYAGLQIFIQLSATLTKLCHSKRDHHHMLKMSTIGRNARWVVVLNMA